MPPQRSHLVSGRREADGEDDVTVGGHWGSRGDSDQQLYCLTSATFNYFKV
jgi:hypothetical protein